MGLDCGREGLKPPHTTKPNLVADVGRVAQGAKGAPAAVGGVAPRAAAHRAVVPCCRAGWICSRGLTIRQNGTTHERRPARSKMRPPRRGSEGCCRERSFARLPAQAHTIRSASRGRGVLPLLLLGNNTPARRLPRPVRYGLPLRTRGKLGSAVDEQ